MNTETKHPTFDADGYPTEETLACIEQWPLSDWPDLLLYMVEAWNTDGKIEIVSKRRYVEIRFITGGWSGNEDIVDALAKTLFWTCYWESSHRGGLHVFHAPKETT